jgi:hypothetical protein
VNDEELNDKDLEKYEARCRDATPGPWTLSDSGGPVICSKDTGSWLGDAVVFASTLGVQVRPADDARFIVVARTAVPRLVADVRRLRQIVASLGRR